MLTQKTSLHDWLFAAGPDPVTRRRFPFSSTLVLPGVNVYEGLGIDDPEKAKWRDFVFRARGRDLKGAIFDLASLPKVDFEGADLQGASLFRTQLQGAALYHAQLQGAALDFTRFQGASLEAARLQGAWLDRAQLQGTSLRDAQLQGASLEYAGLQGASFTGATLEATDLLGAYLWRTTRQQPPSSLTVAIRLDHVNWLPEWIDIDKGKLHPWDAVVYQALRATVDAVPPGSFHDEALRRIEILDCSNFDKTTLASCETQVPPPPEAEAWRLALEAASVDKKAYAEALAKVLHRIVCSRGYNWYDPIDTTDNKIYTLRGPGFQIRLGDAGPAAFGLIDDLMNKDNKDCPVAAALTDADRAKLLEMKQSIEAKTPGGQGEAK